MNKFVVKTETDILRHAIKTSGENAYHSALKAGVSVTILHGNKIQRIDPDGKKVTISKIDLSKKKLLPTRIVMK